mmetsp:Transcript_5049/g.7674  ORF Transcript_5049/g.7674 Transcript_5049/m.7674 type:complete len:291 (-) Transcript_5049:186-1058(-)
MAWLKHARVLRVTNGCRGKHTQAAHQHGCLVGEDVAEQVPADHSVELLGPPDELHCGVVHQHVLQVHFRVVLALLSDHIPPQLAHIQHISLINAVHLLPPLHGHIKGNLGDAGDLPLGVDHVVVAHALPVLVRHGALGLAKVHVPRQLAHHHDVNSFEHLRFESRGPQQLGQNLGWAEVGKKIHFFAHFEETSLRPQMARVFVPFVATNASQEDTIALLALLKRLVRKGVIHFINSNTPNQSVLEVHCEAHLLQRLHGNNRSIGDFWADSVTFEQRDIIRSFFSHCHGNL